MAGPYKKVILTIIDSLNPTALESCFRGGLVPALQFLKDRGQYHTDCVSVFPTMTPTATSSIVTGTMPDMHHVPGFAWFNRREKRFVNYGGSLGAIWKIGLPNVIQDLLFNLNVKQLSRKVRTIYELLEDHGWSTAAINFYIYRGRHTFETKIPFLMKLLTRFRVMSKIRGPRLLVLGEICRPAKLFKDAGLEHLVGPLNKFGINDDFSGKISSYLIKEGKQADLMMVYLPDTDGYAHRHKPKEIEASLIRADKQLGRILDSYPSWDEALEHNVFMVSGDHSQSLINPEADSLIKIGQLLAQFKQASLGRLAINKDLAICSNERMCQIYLLRWREQRVEGIRNRVLSLLQEEQRIDQIMWKDRETGYYHIVRGGKKLSFVRGGGTVDEYGQQWTWEGCLEAVDGRLSEEGRLEFGDYPDGFNRVSGLMNCRNAGDLVCTARPGYEFDGEGLSTHLGTGSHGSLHKEDSCVPLVIAGTNQKMPKPRLTDFVPFILRHFGVELPSYLEK